MHSILLIKQVEKELLQLPAAAARRVAIALDELSERGIKSSNVKKIQTPFPGFRKRVGDYRILFEINEEIVVIYKIVSAPTSIDNEYTTSFAFTL